jgi:hypothetical protein
VKEKLTINQVYAASTVETLFLFPSSGEASFSGF